MSEMLINDLINISSRYLRSTQLERDFNSPESLAGYCVTPETKRHLKRLAKGFSVNSSHRAWRVTGDFGSGKSSFALVLANLISRQASELPKEIRPLQSELNLPKNSPKLLPILITGTREPLTIAVLRALLEALTKSVDGRKLQSAKTLIEELLAEPNVEDRKIIRAIETVTKELVSKKEFGGIVLIIDELGKFLEYAALHPERQDVYFLQSLGESATRSGLNQITVIGLLHQGFAVYADKLSDSSQREWEKVAGRYEELGFNQPLNQVALLLASALQVDTDELPRGWKGRTQQSMVDAVELGMYGLDTGKTALRDLAPGLFPLHPTVLPVLTKFFRRFGQNERSLFSFLLSSEPYALQEFSTQKATLDTSYGLDNFYNFAAQNFGHKLSNLSFRSHWNHIDAVIRSASAESEEVQSILKVIGILNVVESPELAPTEELVSLALSHVEGMDKLLHSLTKRGILFSRGKAGYALWPHTSINLEVAYQNAIDANPSNIPIADVIRERLDVRPVVARRHYIKTGNLRHCAVRFLNVKEFTASCHEGTLKHDHPADGLISIVLCQSGDEQALAIKSAQENTSNPHTLVAISPSLDVLTGITQDLERWHWVERHTPELKDDRFAAEEVTRQIATLSQVLDARLDDYIGFRKELSLESSSRITWFSDGRMISELNEGKSLQSFLSDHFDRLFNKAPQISNELVNRHSISSAAASARQKLFTRILNNGNEKLLGLPEDKAPPEKSMYLSVLLASGIHTQTDKEWRIALPEKDQLRVRPSLEAIISILDEQPDSKVRVDKIRDRLRSAPYGVRDGLIPVFYAVALNLFESELAVYEDGVFQPEIEENLMMRLAKRPETFEFQLCRLSGIRKELLSQFASVVETSQAASSTLLSIVRPLCLFIDQLPDYTQQTSDLSKRAIALRTAIKAAREPAHLIFTAIPKALGFEDLGNDKTDPRKLSSCLEQTLKELRRAYVDLQERMASAIIEIADSPVKTLDEWRTSQSDIAEGLVVEITDTDLRTFCLKLIDDQLPQAEWLESLGSFLTRCPPSRWKDKHEQEFSNRFKELHGKFNRVHATHFQQGKKLFENSIRLALTSRTGQEHGHVVRLSKGDSKKVEKLESEIKTILSKNPDLTLATLSKILWDTLKDK